MIRERRVSGTVEEIHLALSEPAGRLALFGGPAGRRVALRDGASAARVVIEGTPWPGATEVRLAAAASAGETDVAIEAVEAPEEAGAALEAVLGRLELYLGGEIVLEVPVRGEGRACYEAWTGIEANLAFAATAVEQELEVGKDFDWFWLGRGEELTTGKFAEVEPGTRLTFDWSAARGTLVDVRFLPGIGEAPASVRLRQSGFDRSRLGAARRAHAELWLWRLERLRDYVEGTARASREVFAPRARVEAVLSQLRPPQGLTVTIDEAPGARDRVLARCEVPGLPAEEWPKAFAEVLAAAELFLLELASRVAGFSLADLNPDLDPFGPRGFAEEVTVALPPEQVFRAIADAPERARWGPPETTGRRRLAAVPPAVLEEIAPLEAPGGAVTALRFDLAPTAAPTPGTRVRLTQTGYAADAEGAKIARKQRLGWALHLANLRLVLERGLDLRPLSRTGCLYPEWFDHEIAIVAPPAQIAAELVSGAEARGETLIATDGVSRIETLRRLEGPEEVSFCTYTIRREGAGARLLSVHSGFAVEEEFWSLPEKFRLIPAFALARGEEMNRNNALVVGLEAALAQTGSIRPEVQLGGTPETAYAAFTDPAALAAWLDGRARCEPWPGGRFVWAPYGSEREDRGTFLEVDPERRLVFTFEALGRPSLVQVEFLKGETREGRVRVHQTGFSGAPDLAAAETRLWARRLGALAAFVEGRVRREIEVGAPVERTYAALKTEVDLRGWLDPEAAVEPEPDAALTFAIDRALGAVRCKVVSEAEPRRLTLEWPWAGKAGTLAFELDEAKHGRTRVAAEIAGFTEGVERPEALVRDARDFLGFALRSLRSAVEGAGGYAPEAAGGPYVGAGRLELAAELPLGPEAAFEAITGRVRGVFARFVEEAAPRRFVALAPAAPGEPEGLTIVTVAIEGAKGGGSRVRVLEEGFREGEAWEARFTTEDYGWRTFLSELGAKDL